ncbi:EVE domain-containing protein [Vibrio fluvialis]|uniref:EVE domain-containing protein n=1 Tax=Vibrio fluvialis TaxID=676 RepID=UPI001F47A661|nr:EVE domain-containing protein [Vibrio fluvialis]MCE7624168.1 EVE domain-containing protein [Vibrio fluvialis]
MSNYYVFIKGDSYHKDGRLISAKEAAEQLMSSKIWPLYQRTAHRRSVQVGDHILFYVSGKRKGAQVVLGSAIVSGKEEWKKFHTNHCPIHSENIPYTAILFEDVVYFPEPIQVRDKVENLTFIKQRPQKWGLSFMGGVTKIDKTSFEILSN